MSQCTALMTDDKVSDIIVMTAVNENMLPMLLLPCHTCSHLWHVYIMHGRRKSIHKVAIVPSPKRTFWIWTICSVQQKQWWKWSSPWVWEGLWGVGKRKLKQVVWCSVGLDPAGLGTKHRHTHAVLKQRLLVTDIWQMGDIQALQHF